MFRSIVVIWAFLVVLILSIGSCTSDLNFDLTNVQKKLVINCLFIRGENFKVRLTSSRNILDSNSQIERITEATVILKDGNGKVLEILKEVGEIGLYGTTGKAFAGYEYNIEVTHPDFGDEVYSASSYIPLISENTTIDASVVSFTDRDALKINVLIDDKNEDKETYIFEVELKDDEILAPLLSYDDEAIIYGDTEGPKRLFLADDNFNGTKRNFDFFTFEGLSNDSTNTETTVRMLNASAELAEYYKSLERYELAQKTLNPNAATPIELFSNIKRGEDKLGFGIFAGANSKELFIKY